MNNVDVKNIYFSDDCKFYLNEFVDKHNFMYWSNEKHVYIEGQYREKKCMGRYFTR